MTLLFWGIGRQFRIRKVVALQAVAAAATVACMYWESC